MSSVITIAVKTNDDLVYILSNRVINKTWKDFSKILNRKTKMSLMFGQEIKYFDDNNNEKSGLFVECFSKYVLYIFLFKLYNLFISNL